MLCDACCKSLDGKDAVLLKPCGHRVHAGKCEGEACKACKFETDANKYLGDGALFALGFVCGVLFVCLLMMTTPTQPAFNDAQLSLAKMSKLAASSPTMRPAIKQSLDRITAVILKEMVMCCL